MVKPINPVKRIWMKQKRLDNHLTIRETALRLGISHQHYADIEHGRRNPSFELALRIAELFEVPLEKFMNDRTKFQHEGNYLQDGAQ